MAIQWFPGHMFKAQKEIKKVMSKVDVVIEVLGYGPKVSWIIFVSMILALALVFFLRLMGQTWRRPEVIDRMMAESQ